MPRGCCLLLDPGTEVLMAKALVREIGLTTHAALRYEGCEHLQLVAIECVVYTVM
jgi:hypothetical protein